MDQDIRHEWALLEETAGMPQAELLGSLLEAEGIPVWLTQEGAGKALGLTIGPLGVAQILVPADRLEEARRLLDDVGQGTFDWSAGSNDGNSAADDIPDDESLAVEDE